jgi:hypothetical protein
MDVVKLDQDVAYVASVFQRHVVRICSKCFISFQTYVVSVLILMLYMFHIYFCNVIAVSVLCCSMCFHIVSCKCLI